MEREGGMEVEYPVGEGDPHGDGGVPMGSGCPYGLRGSP